MKDFISLRHKETFKNWRCTCCHVFIGVLLLDLYFHCWLSPKKVFMGLFLSFKFLADVEYFFFSVIVFKFLFGMLTTLLQIIKLSDVWWIAIRLTCSTRRCLLTWLCFFVFIFLWNCAKIWSNRCSNSGLKADNK